MNTLTLKSLASISIIMKIDENIYFIFIDHHTKFGCNPIKNKKSPLGTPSPKVAHSYRLP